MKFIYFTLISFLLLLGCKETPKYTEQTQESNIFRATERTLISAHRGGSGLKNYPENCLETIAYLHQKGIDVFEIDITQTADGEMMLLHDDYLDRTTTGDGKARGKTAEDLLKYNLVDDFGNRTRYKIPFLKDVLAWGKENDAYFMIDFKHNTSYSRTIEVIKQAEMESHCVLISYNVNQAQKLHKLAPNILLSVSARNERELDWILATSIPTEKMIAFTGTKLSNQELYDRIKNLTIPMILGTLGNLDKRAKAKNDRLYKNWAAMGINIFATDRPLEAYQSVK